MTLNALSSFLPGQSNSDRGREEPRSSAAAEEEDALLLTHPLITRKRRKITVKKKLKSIEERRRKDLARGCPKSDLGKAVIRDLSAFPRLCQSRAVPTPVTGFVPW